MAAMASGLLGEDEATERTAVTHPRSDEGLPRAIARLVDGGSGVLDRIEV
jgi:hypothetical protein